MTRDPERLLRIARGRLAKAAALALALLVLAVNEIGYRSAQIFDSGMDEALQARLAVVQIRRLLVDAESAQRGYLITGRPEYQQPYLRARAELNTRLAELGRRLDPANPHAAAVQRLDEASSERVSELDEVMRLFDKGDKERAVTLMLTDIGREKMLAVEDEAEHIESATIGTFVDHQRHLQRALSWSHVGIASLTLFGLALAWLWLGQLRVRDSERAAQQAALQAERDKLEGEVAERTAELTELARHLQTVRESERGRLARELHDELGGLMTAAKIDVARVRNKLDPLAADVAERLQHLMQMLDAGIALKRRIVEDLQPSSLRNLGLEAALRILCADFERASEIEVLATIEPVRIDEEHALSVYRLVQEALTNVGKHADAAQVVVTLRQIERQVTVSVADDGHGFDTWARGSAGHGLAGMRFRISSAGGRMQVRSTPGSGTTIEASLPAAA
ncbi:MAG: CHASE3 domain-containing protein [Burkholderiales bacterium]|nr:CHASE3 domain-containing protein [Burkholderiales bacterium]